MQNDRGGRGRIGFPCHDRKYHNGYQNTTRQFMRRTQGSTYFYNRYLNICLDSAHQPPGNSHFHITVI
jgi:hypothetical protein